jgi:hypothetical protein
MLVEYLFDNVHIFFETCKCGFLIYFAIEGAQVLRSKRDFLIFLPLFQNKTVSMQNRLQETA